MDKQKKVIALVAVLLCIIAGCIVYAVMKPGKKEETSPDHQVSETKKVEKEERDLSEKTESMMETEAFESESMTESGEAFTSSGNVPSDQSVSTGGNVSVSDESAGSVEEPAKKLLSFPYKDQASKVTVKKVAPYSGYFLEDGSDRDVDNIAVLVLENTGKKEIEYVTVTLFSDDETYHFEGSVLPVGSQLVLQEKDGKVFGDYAWESCDLLYGDIEAFDFIADQVSFTERDDDSIEITNISAEAIPCLRVFYKHYLEEENAYLGGITYNAKITGLEAGASMIIKPSHYKSGESKVVFIRRYETEE